MAAKFDTTVTGWPAPSSTIGTLETIGLPVESRIAKVPKSALDRAVRASSAKVGFNTLVVSTVPPPALTYKLAAIDH